MNLQERITVSMLFLMDRIMNIVSLGAWEKIRGQKNSGAYFPDDNRQ